MNVQRILIPVNRILRLVSTHKEALDVFTKIPLVTLVTGTMRNFSPVRT
ncbi:hypothetical protein E2C01_063212 [Portunus trituberculatus]|uniref:Uncharacterized protein n=1 Tax=Portunus trituberculatus TaxID=210409 RepID=A0A5B7HGZ2_PORTR|nr:hypothetical protein [Portunus trituberculatus]